MNTSKVRENRIRRVLARRYGYLLRRSPRRDPLARTYGLYRITTDDDATVAGGGRNPP